MTANATALKIRVFIGEDLLEFTEQLYLFTVGYTKRDRSGLFFTEGELTLVDTISERPRESLNSRKNPGRWKRGNPVLIQVQRFNGSWVTHPMGKLYIIKEPLPPNPDDPLVKIPVGDILRLRDYKQPDEDKSGVELGSETNRGEIIQNILSASGISFNETLNDYPLDVPLPKQDGGSFVSQAGEIAYTTLQALYQRNDGSIGLRSISTYPETPKLTVSIGGVFTGNTEELESEATEEIGYESLSSEETPVDKLKVVGDKKAAKYLQDSTTYESYFYAPAGVLGGEGEGIIVSRFIKGSETFTQYYRVVEEEIYEPKGIQNSTAFPGDATIVLASKSREQYFYEVNEANKLEKTVKESQLWLPGALANFYNSLDAEGQDVYRNAYANSKIETRWDYDLLTEIPTQQTVTEDLPLGQIVDDEPELSNAGSAVTASIETTQWVNLGHESYYKKSVSRQESAALIGEVNTTAEDLNTRVNAKKGLINSEYTVSVSNSGQNNPPSPERGQPNIVESEEPIEGSAEFDTAGTSEQPRERTIQVNYATSKDQLARIAAVEGAILIGKRLGQRFQIPFVEVFIDHPYPLLHLIAIEPDGTTYHYIADGIEYTHSATEALIGFDGIWIATLPDNDGLPQDYAIDALQAPYQGAVLDIPVSENVVLPPSLYISTHVYGGFNIGGTVDVLPYSLEPQSLTIYGGFVVGGTAIFGSGVTSYGGFVIGGTVTLNQATQVNGGFVIGGSVTGEVGDLSVNGGFVIGGESTISAITDRLYGGVVVGGDSTGFLGSIIEGGFVIGGSVTGEISDLSINGGFVVGGDVIANPGVIAYGGFVIGGLVNTLEIDQVYGGVVVGGTVTGSIVSNYETETNNLLSRFNNANADYTTNDQNAINDLIAGLKSDGLWSGIDILYIFAAPVEADSLLNWKQNNYNASKVGTPTFTTNSGWDNWATSRYLNTGFTPSTAGGNFTQNSGSMAIYVATNVNEAQYDCGARTLSPSAFLSITSNNGGSARVEINNSTVFLATNSDARGLNWVVRTASNDARFYKNNAQVGSTSTNASAGLPTQPIYIGTVNNTGSPLGQSSKRLRGFVLATGWNSTQVSNFYSRWNTYMTYRGVNV